MADIWFMVHLLRPFCPPFRCVVHSLYIVQCIHTRFKMRCLSLFYINLHRVEVVDLVFSIQNLRTQSFTQQMYCNFYYYCTIMPTYCLHAKKSLISLTHKAALQSSRLSVLKIEFASPITITYAHAVIYVVCIDILQLFQSFKRSSLLCCSSFQACTNALSF